MDCGCNSDSGSGPLLSGQLDSRFASPSGADSQDSFVGDLESVAHGKFSLAGVLVAGIVVALVLGALSLLKKEN